MESLPAALPSRTPAEWWWVFDPRQSVRARAVLLFGGSSLLLTLLLTWAAGAILRVQLEHNLSRWFETLAFEVGDKLDRTIYERYRALEMTASLVPFRTAHTAPDERRRVLETLQQAAPDFGWIGFADAGGTISGATEKIFEGASVSSRGWFRAGSNGPYAGPFHDVAELPRATSETDDEYAHKFLDLAVPVQDDAGRFNGVLGAHLRWNWAQAVQKSVVPETRAGEHLDLTVYGPSGEILLDSGDNDRMQPPPLPPNLDARAPRGSFVETTSDGVTYFTAYARGRGYREYRGLGWTTLVRQPVSEALAAVSTARQTVFWCGFAVTAGLAIAIWHFSGRYSRRMLAIATAADRIRTGDVLTTTPSSPGDAEFAVMCAAILEMAEHFRDQQEKLDPTTAHTEPHFRSRAPSSSEIHRVI